MLSGIESVDCETCLDRRYKCQSPVELLPSSRTVLFGWNWMRRGASMVSRHEVISLSGRSAVIAGVEDVLSTPKGQR